MINNMNIKQVCACCEKGVVGFFDICKICGWQNDDLQNREPDFDGGANEMSLNEAKQAYKEGKEIF